MGRPEFPAIRYPTPWPPPDPPEFPSHPWSRLPLIGRVFHYFRWIRYSGQHQKAVVEPIADEIISQLETRPAEGPWPTAPKQRAFAQIVSDAVRQEKGLTNPPALHPDDPFPLLFWGPFDDITPLIVKMESRNKLKFEIADNLFVDAWNQRWTIQQFIEQCTETMSPSVQC